MAIGLLQTPPLALMAIGSIFSNIGTYRPLFAQPACDCVEPVAGVSAGAAADVAPAGAVGQFAVVGGVLLHLAVAGV